MSEAKLIFILSFSWWSIVCHKKCIFNLFFLSNKQKSAKTVLRSIAGVRYAKNPSSEFYVCAWVSRKNAIKKGRIPSSFLYISILHWFFQFSLMFCALNESVNNKLASKGIRFKVSCIIQAMIFYLMNFVYCECSLQLCMITYLTCCFGYLRHFECLSSTSLNTKCIIFISKEA